MSREQLMNRLLSMESKVDSQHLRTGNLKDDDGAKADRERRHDPVNPD